MTDIDTKREQSDSRLNYGQKDDYSIAEQRQLSEIERELADNYSFEEDYLSDALGHAYEGILNNEKEFIEFVEAFRIKDKELIGRMITVKMWEYLESEAKKDAPDRLGNDD